MTPFDLLLGRRLYGSPELWLHVQLVNLSSFLNIQKQQIVRLCTAMAPSSELSEFTASAANHFNDRESWIECFVGIKGNEFFCKIDVEFIRDKFNLTGLHFEVSDIRAAINTITSDAPPPPVETPEDERAAADAAHLYGLIHARYILTTRGLHRMLCKYNNQVFGQCPRALCRGELLLPIGLYDQPHEGHLKLYCPRCEDVYNPKSSRHAMIDGAYFGTSFPAMFLQAYPKMMPRRSSERFVLCVFGFKLHANAELARWQSHQRQEMEKRIAQRAASSPAPSQDGMVP